MRLLVFKLAAFLPLLFAMMLVSWYIDPARIFHHAGDDAEEQLAEIMLSGRNAELFNQNFDDRLLQRFYIEQLTEAPDVLVLGSSRGMQVNSSLFPGECFYNASVSGALLQDYVAICQLYYENGLAPKTIIIEIDPWQFNRNTRQARWRTLADEYRRGLARIAQGTGPRDDAASNYGGVKFLELLSPDYYQHSLRFILTGRSEGFKIEATMSDESKNPLRFADGSRQYGAYRLNLSPEQVQALAVNYVTEAYRYPIGSFYAIDPDYTKLFECTVDDLLSRRTEVIIFLPPYNPVAYELLLADRQYCIIAEVEDYVRHFAMTRNIRVCGSYDPAKDGFVEPDFVDGAHTTRESLARISWR
jgi:hypothetical protein